MKRVDLHDVRWFKSSYSNANGDCVEVAYLPGAVATRDSGQQAGPVLTTSVEEWKAFVASVVNGEIGAR